MEFFRIIKVKTTESHILNKLNLIDLEMMSNEFFPLDEPTETKVNIGGIWGEFTLSRYIIKGGLRFALDECPNALAWTVTTGYPPDRDAIVVHLTINRQRKQQEFIDEINIFLDDHSACLMELFNQ